MTIKSDEAAAMLKEVENVVARVKQSRIYRVAAVIVIIWGLIDLVRSDLIGRFGPRERMAFWPTLFLFGFSVAGLWFGAAFTLMGLGLAALVVAGYLWSGDAFPLWQAVVTGLGFILCGLWMRRA